jgi:hypothetical protein
MKLFHRCKSSLFKTWSFFIVANCSCSKHEAFSSLQIVPVQNMKLLHRCKNAGPGNTETGEDAFPFASI